MNEHHEHCETDYPRDRVGAFVDALRHRPDGHAVQIVATSASGHQEVTLTLGDLRALLAEGQGQ